MVTSILRSLPKRVFPKTLHGAIARSDGIGAFAQFLFDPPTDCGADREQVDTWHEMVRQGGDKADEASSSGGDLSNKRNSGSRLVTS